MTFNFEKESKGLNAFLANSLKEKGVNGISIAIVDGEKRHNLTSGYADVSKRTRMTENTWLQCASLSKTVASAFAVEYFTKRKVPFTTPVNNLLEACNASFRLSLHPKNVNVAGSELWVSELQLKHLVNHTGLGMHYVYGIPPSHGIPSMTDLLTGKCEKKYGYSHLYVEKKPGAHFHYSGGGFLVLQLLLEMMEKKPIQDIMQPFLHAMGIQEGLNFEQATLGGHAKDLAIGYSDDGKTIREGRLLFPPLAAGGHGTPTALLEFLIHLAKAYKLKKGDKSGPIAHETAVDMLLTHNVDKGCFSFMHSVMGLGVFVLKAGKNRFMMHQAANDGFRGLYLVCFDGPDAAKGPRGFVVLANGDNKAMFLNCAVTKHLLKTMQFKGMNWDLVEKTSFDIKGIAQEQIVNLGLKGLVLEAFDQSDATPSKL